MNRSYMRVAIMLISGTICLFVILGAAVYLGLKRQVVWDGTTTLSTEVREVETDIQSRIRYDSNHQLSKFPLSDDRGQDIYFVALERGIVRFSSILMPVSLGELRSKVPFQGDRCSEFSSEGKYYRACTRPWAVQGENYRITVYTLITQEHALLARTRDILLLAGMVGVFIAVGGNLWLAKYAVRPAKESWEAHQDMMLALSHELQTPLATIGAVAAGQVKEKATRSTLLHEVSHASNLVHNILYLARLRSEQTRLHYDPIAVSDLTTEVAERFIPLAKVRAIELKGQAQEGLFVVADSERWSRLVSTLLKNVIDHAEQGSVAYWSLKALDDEFAELKVHNLIGVPKEHARKELHSHPFSVSPQGRGHGFGLQIVEHLVRDMRGKMEIHQDEQSYEVVVQVPIVHVTVNISSRFR